MATITKTIGATGRDYSTMALWEADLDDSGIYSAGDNAVGECYDDAAFTASVTINGGGTIGLATVKLTAAAADRHDGTAGTGVRMVGALSITLNPPTTGNDKLICEWIEVNANGGGINSGVICSGDANEFPTVKHCILHDSVGNSSLSPAMQTISRDAKFIRNIIYDWNHSTSGRSCVAINSIGQASGCVIGNTVYNITGNGAGTGKGIDVSADVAGFICQNNISVNTSSFDFEFAGTTNGTYGNNLSEDTTATGGSGNVTSVTVSDLFVSTTGGSEDFHLKTGSPAINVGVDLVTTPTGVNIDIDGRDLDALGDTWDIGADEYVAVGGGSVIKTFNGLANASTKTWNGLANASIKSFNGVSNV